MLELLNDLIDVTPVDLVDLGDILPDTDNVKAETMALPHDAMADQWGNVA